jgi:hypothetical protein
MAGTAQIVKLKLEMRRADDRKGQGEAGSCRIISRSAR